MQQYFPGVQYHTIHDWNKEKLSLCKDIPSTIIGVVHCCQGHIALPVLLMRQTVYPITMTDTSFCMNCDTKVQQIICFLYLSASSSNLPHLHDE